MSNLAYIIVGSEKITMGCSAGIFLLITMHLINFIFINVAKKTKEGKLLRIPQERLRSTFLIMFPSFVLIILEFVHVFRLMNKFNQWSAGEESLSEDLTEEETKSWQSKGNYMIQVLCGIFTALTRGYFYTRNANEFTSISKRPNILKWSFPKLTKLESNCLSVFYVAFGILVFLQFF